MIINTIYGVEQVTSMECRYCKEKKPLFDFPKHKSRLTGWIIDAENVKMKDRLL